MKSLSKKLRFEVFKRDSFSCQYCGKSAPQVILHADHIVPRSKGGKDTILNLVTSCQDCNLGKSDRELSDGTAISKSKNQADALQERRNQIELMAKWYSEIESQSQSEIDIVEGIISSHCPYGLSESGRQSMRARIKKYGLAAVAEKAGDIFSSNPADSEDFSACIARLDKALKWGLTPIHIQKSHYITAVIRNRFNNSFDWQDRFKSILMLILEDFPESHKQFYKIAANSDDLSQARDSMIQAGVDLGVHEEDLIRIWNRS